MNDARKELGIYIHIPYCKRKCSYCDFISYTDTKLEDEYINSIIKELKKYSLEEYDITTIYIGGGTPSYIKSENIVKILNTIKEELKNTQNPTSFEDIEITIEVNPGTTNKEKMNDYRKCGINRISIGLQTTNDVLLKKIGRIHNYNDFLETYKNAQNAGIDNINVDLMLGLPEQKIQDLKDSLEKVINLNPNHISVYSLILEEGTPLEKMVKENKLLLPDEEVERQMYWYVKNTLELHGYNHYEISNFSKKGKESKHNLNCWKQKEYIGIGVAAHSYLNKIRYSNTIKIEKYIENIKKLEEVTNINEEIKNNLKGIYQINEKQSLEDQKKEYMILRTKTY